MDIFQAVKICRDIKKLNRTENICRVYSRRLLCKSNWYEIRVFDDNSVIESGICRHELADDKIVPNNLWATICNTSGTFKPLPLRFTVKLNNKGILPHAPVNECQIIHGLPALLIYNRVRHEYKMAERSNNR